MINLVFIKVITTGRAPSRAAAAVRIQNDHCGRAVSGSLHQLFWGRVRVGSIGGSESLLEPPLS
jgi:hypothetical protein